MGSAFKKLSRVAADLAKVSVAAVLVRDGERVLDCRLALGSVGPTVIRAKRAEALLAGNRFSLQLALEAGSLAAEEVQPIDDVRSTAWYRREAAKAVTHDALVQAWARASETPGAQRAAGDRKAHDVDSAPRTRRLLRLGPQEQHLIALTVNGEEHRLWVTANELLLNVLRERLALTGTKYGCGIGECGACTVQLNGAPALACLTLAVTADGSEVCTIEGMQSADGTLHPLQEAFIEHQAFQCGYCTPGMLVMSRSLLEELPSPTEDDVRAYLRGNRCRCTGFASIVRAVLSCAEAARDRR
jgi:aerobic-type carbon monoxide dehydrogenase small subunit (CoxS/CutS family)